MKRIQLIVLIIIAISIVSKGQTLNVPDNIGTSINAGKVGIGTTKPSQTLDVNGRILVSKPYDPLGFETNGLILRNSTLANNTSVNGISLATSTVINYGYSINAIRTSQGQGSFNINYHINNANGISRFFIDQNGKVGIGTITPEAQLEVNGQLNIGDFTNNGVGNLQVKGDGANHGITVWNESGITTWRMWIHDNNDMGYLTRGTDPLNGIGVTTNGNVLIGKTSQLNSNYKLDVAGPIRANEIVVNTDGADFVFESEYKLRSLAEVERFIVKNNHLPEIAPAKEMGKNGTNLGELNTKLLQKIEELTLYMIEQNKKTKKLMEEVQGLKTKNKTLQKEIDELKFHKR
nr:hypothetical protein [uncultured Draconibacterium sp.]